MKDRKDQMEKNGTQLFLCGFNKKSFFKSVSFELGSLQIAEKQKNNVTCTKSALGREKNGWKKQNDEDRSCKSNGIKIEWDHND